MKYLTLKLQYIFSLLIFVGNNENSFTINVDNYNILTRQRSNLHLLQAN